MSQYYELLKNETINFDKLLIEKYNTLGLDEVEVIILIKINKVISSGKKLSIEKIAKGMSITEENLRNKLVTLINNQFITLMLDGKNEVYSIDDTYKRLAETLVENDKSEIDANDETMMKKVVELLQKMFNKILTPLDLEVVHHWIYDDKFGYDQINDAVLETLKLKKTSIQYVDAILNKPKPVKKEKSGEGLQELFNQVYGKIK